MTKASKIIQFPTNVIAFPKRGPIAKIEKQLEAMQDLMKIQYRHIVEMGKKLGLSEKECRETEKGYNSLLMQYSKRIGPQNVSLKYLDWTTDLVFNIDDEGTLKIQYTPEEPKL